MRPAECLAQASHVFRKEQVVLSPAGEKMWSKTHHVKCNVLNIKRNGGNRCGRQ